MLKIIKTKIYTNDGINLDEVKQKSINCNKFESINKHKRNNRERAKKSKIKNNVHLTHIS
jgi:hypothetical protein